MTKTYRQRRLLTALQHDRVTRRQRGRDLVREHAQREIPRDDQGDGAIRLLDGHAQDAGRVRARRALHMPGAVGEIPELFGGNAAVDKEANRAADGESFEPGELVVVFLEELGHFAQVGAALFDAEIAPGGEGRFGGCDGVVDIIFVGFVDCSLR